MGATLPALPKEKAVQGKPDEAYGAFQRGYYLTAMELALPRRRRGMRRRRRLWRKSSPWPRRGAQHQRMPPSGMNRPPMRAIRGHVQIRADADGRARRAARPQARRCADARCGRHGQCIGQFNYAQTLVADTPARRAEGGAALLREVAEKGIADAQYALAQIYMNVEGISDDKRATARGWLLRAAASGFDTPSSMPASGWSMALAATAIWSRASAGCARRRSAAM